MIKDIAIIGAGISGLSAAYLLAQRYRVTVYEAEARIGGHSRTIDVATTNDGVLPVDTGFIVFNERNYPNLCALFEHLGITSQDIPMSFGLSAEGGKLQYASTALFGQKANFLRPRYWRMLLDILRFNRAAQSFLQQAHANEPSLDFYLNAHKFGDYFKNYYLRPMVAAIWSCPPDLMDHYPARSLLTFLDNHGLLTVNQQPQWRSVVGGSREYLHKISQPFADSICLRCPIQALAPQADGSVLLTDSNGQQYHHDAAVLACHGDQAARLLHQHQDHPLAAVLTNFRCYDNSIVVHSDPSLMPPQRSVWASWNYLQDNQDDRLCLSYWMNNLQKLATEQPIIVSLNPSREPRPELVHDRHQFRHPIFDHTAVAAQRALQQHQGHANIWSCGAWQGYGFHEDGLRSAIGVAQALGCPPPWQ